MSICGVRAFSFSASIRCLCISRRKYNYFICFGCAFLFVLFFVLRFFIIKLNYGLLLWPEFIDMLKP